MLDDPGRIDAHVVGHHVAGEANAVAVGAVAQVDVGRLAAEIVGDAVVEERVGRGDGVLVAAELLDGLGGAAALPHADEPERVDAAARERGQLFVGNLVEAADVAAVLAAELRQPDVGALGDEHGAGHPGLCRVRISRIRARDRRRWGPRQWLMTDGHCCGAAQREPGGLNCIQMASSSSRRTSPPSARNRSRVSPSSGFQSWRMISS